MMKRFDKVLSNYKFKSAGKGHSLQDDASPGTSTTSDSDPSNASLRAALLRSEKPNPRNNESFSQTQDMVKASSAKNEDVLFTCSEIDSDIRTWGDWKERIRDHIDTTIKLSNPTVAAILAIKSLNSVVGNRKEVTDCIKILKTLVENINKNPDVEKFKVIKLENKTIEKILEVTGALDFLLAIGFGKQTISYADGNKECLVYTPVEDVDLKGSIDLLETVTGYTLILHRNIKVTLPLSTEGIKEETPDDFYKRSTQDIKKEHSNKLAVREKEQQLRTKKMREADDKGKPKKRCNFPTIKVSFPDGLVVQGSFAINEKLSEVRSALNQKFKFSNNFGFVRPLESKELDEEKTLFDLDLYPAVNLLVKWTDPNGKNDYNVIENVEK